MKTAIAILLVLLAVGNARSEDLSEVTEPAHILALLDTGSPREMAWGAYLAGREQVRGAIPRLADLLKPLPDREGPEWEYLRYAVLDALNLLEARVPGEVAPELVHANAKSKGWRPALILLSRQPEKNAGVLLSMFKYAGWEYVGNGPLAIGNLLCATKAKGFTACLLAGLPTHLEITVRDPDSGFGGGGGGGGGGRGDGYLRLPEGFPPYGRYLFWNGRPPTAALLADGPIPVYYTRQELAGRGIMTGIDGANHDARQRVLAWLADMLREPESSLEFPERRRKTLEWTATEKLLEDAADAREWALRPWRGLVTRGLAGGLLTEAEAKGLTPRLEIQVQDRRSDKTVPLPDLTGK